MYIKSINIQNFKCFQNQKIELDPNFNLIIGENNSGKSTLFEALRFWQLAIQQFYTARTQKKTNNIGFYKRYSYQALEISDLTFLRIQDIKDVFYKQDIPFIIEICFSNGSLDSNVPISFKRTSRNSLNCKIGYDISGIEKSAELNLRKISNDLFKVMNIANNDTFRNRIRLAYIPPKFNLPNKEILLSDKNEFIVENLILGKSQRVIRNILHPWCELDYRRKTKKAKLSKLKSDLKGVVDESIFNEKYKTIIKPYIENVLQAKIISNENKKNKSLENIENGLKNILDQKFNFKSYQEPTKYSSLSIKNSLDSIEISQLGSGTINVLNILSVLEYNNQTIDKAATKCNLLLLDEPDSHLHSNLQKELFSHLEKQSQDADTQIFIITHNSNLISQFDRVLFIEQNSTTIKPITINNYLENHLINMDYNQYKIIKKLNDIKEVNKTLQDELNQSCEIIILFEGATDIKIFKIAYKKLYRIDFPYTIKEKVSSAGQIPPVFNGHNNSIGFLIGIFDNDHTGRSQFNNIDSNFKKDGELYKFKNNALAMLLPIPDDRSFPFYKKHFTTEYLFSDADLKAMDVALIQDDGENYKKIEPKENTQAYCIKDSEKQRIANECDKLQVDAFKNFRPIFDKFKEFTTKPNQ